ncbi:alpha/beta fold hydrolase [Amycolatopsis sp.]|uniref:alpha/beta fold hydrolase n=1 Tax=Amycolatopsis sp. TaxID=37632 RepID=UPI002D7E4391|nr:alpha/beta fold hydrolase [Amycolatopsis sp.]HET6704124.1 alpha/beta fold hydrolase [Amycolatopsis sp.]
MDLIPKPDQVVSAASNVAHMVLYGGLADLRPMPRTLIEEGELREVYHYRADPTAPAEGDPVLLVTPLAAPALCFDLRRGCSVVEHLVKTGRPTYLVEYGQVSFRNRALGMEHWVDDVVPAAIRAASEHAGGRPVHVVGWSLGGIFALLTAADQRELPIASLSVVGSPVDTKKVPLMAPVRPLLNLTEGRGMITRAYQAMGGAPKPLVRWAFQLSSFQKLVTKPLAVATKLDDTDFLAQLEAVDRFTDNMIAYPGRSFGQLYHRFVKGNALVTGSMDFGDRSIHLEDVAVPVLVFAGNTDGIAPVPAVKAVVDLLTGSPEVRFEIVPGGHLGMLTGRAARETTWRVLGEWFSQWSSDVAGAPAGKGESRRTASRKAAAKKSAKKAAKKAAKAPAKKAATKTAVKKSAGKKAAGKPAAQKPAKAPASQPAAKTAVRKSVGKKAPVRKRSTGASSEAIGANPSRRYGSAGSRALSRP